MDAALRAEFYRPLDNVDYTWRRRIFRRLMQMLVFPTLLQVKVVEGLETVPLTGGTIFFINHTSFVDPVAVLGVVERNDVVPMSKIENFKTPIISWFMRNWGAFSVRRGEVDRRALGYGIRVLQQGGAILMSPEGTRAPCLLPAHNGIAFMATRGNAVLVPVGLEGADQFRHDVRKARRTTVWLRFGRPFRFCKLSLPSVARRSRDRLGQMTTEAMYQLASLLPERLRGDYYDLRLATTSHLVFEDQPA